MTLEQLEVYWWNNPKEQQALDPHFDRLSALNDFLKSAFEDHTSPPAYDQIPWILAPLAGSTPCRRYREKYSDVIFIDVDFQGRKLEGWCVFLSNLHSFSLTSNAHPHREDLGEDNEEMYNPPCQPIDREIEEMVEERYVFCTCFDLILFD